MPGVRSGSRTIVPFPFLLREVVVNGAAAAQAQPCADLGECRRPPLVEDRRADDASSSSASLHLAIDQAEHRRRQNAGLGVATRHGFARHGLPTAGNVYRGIHPPR